MHRISGKIKLKTFNALKLWDYQPQIELKLIYLLISNYQYKAFFLLLTVINVTHDWLQNISLIKTSNSKDSQNDYSYILLPSSPGTMGGKTLNWNCEKLGSSKKLHPSSYFYDFTLRKSSSLKSNSFSDF